MGFEEDTYNTIFKAIQHPIRRRILRMIGEKPSTYTEIQRDLNIDNGLLNYHLEALSSLITKNGEEKYTLSDFGRATAGLIRGVEEPSKVVKSTFTSPIMKVLAAVLVVALVVSGLGLIELNNRYLDLSGRYSTQSIEKSYLQSALNTSVASSSRLNSTLTTLEKNPLVRASTIIIDRVGVDYFNKYFHDPTVESNPANQPNATRVTYSYRIEVGNYSKDEKIIFEFHPEYIMQSGEIPVEGNLQPYNITAAEAKRLALNAGLFDSPYGLAAEIVGAFGYDVNPQSPYTDKYVWQVTSYIDPPWARTRMYMYAMVDPVTGQVYSTNGRGGLGLSESQVDTAAKAAAQGIDGYVKLVYPDLPEQIQILGGGNLTFTVSATFISYNVNTPYAKLIIDPQYRDPYQVQSNMADRLRDVLTYEPVGSLPLRTGETVNITATVRAPDDAGQVFVFPRWALDDLGISADGILVLSNLES
ncbi:MAG: helix-turn-helix domain-containing protein [Candidatus Bathyarchaeia archaeon]|jgi:DNA-binding transcriptional ArsR family regulator